MLWLEELALSSTWIEVEIKGKSFNATTPFLGILLKMSPLWKGQSARLLVADGIIDNENSKKLRKGISFHLKKKKRPRKWVLLTISLLGSKLPEGWRAVSGIHHSDNTHGLILEQSCIRWGPSRRMHGFGFVFFRTFYQHLLQHFNSPEYGWRRKKKETFGNPRWHHVQFRFFYFK